VLKLTLKKLKDKKFCTYHAIDAILVAHELCNGGKTGLGHVPHPERWLVSAFSGDQVLAVRGVGEADDRFSGRVEQMRLRSLPGVEQHHGAPDHTRGN